MNTKKYGEDPGGHAQKYFMAFCPARTDIFFYRRKHDNHAFQSNTDNDDGSTIVITEVGISIPHKNIKN